MKRVLVILGMFVLSITFGQQEPIVLKSFVKKDTVQLRWAPTSVAILIDGLKNGYEIIRTGPDGSKSIDVLPFKTRKSSFVPKDSFEVALAEYVSDFSQATPSELLEMPFAILTLGASPYKSIARLSGVYYEDINLPKGEYSYQIKTKDGKSNSNSVSVKTPDMSKNVACTELIAESRVDIKEAFIHWEAKELNEFYGGYWILKSEDKQNFEVLNKTPLFYFTSQYEENKTVIDFVDTAVVEGKTYYYQIQPMNQFGDKGAKSNIAEVYIQKRLNGICVIDTVKMKDFNREILGWYKSDTEDEIGEFILTRSDSIKGPYSEVERTSATDNNFVFNYKASLTSGDRHYFKVIALSVDGDSAYSYPYYHFSLDQIPPGKCTELTGVIDSLGIARLTWNAPEDKDIRGYRVFRSNSEKGEYIEVTRTFAENGKFSDTLYLGSLTNEVYYKVRAVDLNFNNGPLTKGVLLMKPDTIAPVAGVIKAYKVKESGIYLAWNNSSSEDLKQQYLIRKSKVKVDTVLKFHKEKDTLLDVSGKVGASYQYALIAEDESGNTSESKAIHIKYEIGYRPAPEFVKVEVLRDSQMIKLEWEKSAEDIYAIKIYRAKADGKFRLYKTIREDVNVLEDKDLNINNEYHYKIQIKYNSGIQSKLSEVKSVMY